LRKPRKARNPRKARKAINKLRDTFLRKPKVAQRVQIFSDNGGLAGFRLHEEKNMKRLMMLLVAVVVAMVGCAKDEPETKSDCEKAFGIMKDAAEKTCNDFEDCQFCDCLQVGELPWQEDDILRCESRENIEECEGWRIGWSKWCVEDEARCAKSMIIDNIKSNCS
jgi:hypothetical protein